MRGFGFQVSLVCAAIEIFSVEAVVENLQYFDNIPDLQSFFFELFFNVFKSTHASIHLPVVPVAIGHQSDSKIIPFGDIRCFFSI